MKHWLVDHWLSVEQAVAQCEPGDIIELMNGQQVEVVWKRGDTMDQIDVKVLRGPVAPKIGEMGIG